MFFAPSSTTGVAAERTFAALGAGEYRPHTALASQKIIAGMVPDEEPHGFQYIARFPFRGYFRHLYARIRKLWLEEYPVKCLKQAVYSCIWLFIASPSVFELTTIYRHLFSSEWLS